MRPYESEIRKRNVLRELEKRPWCQQEIFVVEMAEENRMALNWMNQFLESLKKNPDRRDYETEYCILGFNREDVWVMQDFRKAECLEMIPLESEEGGLAVYESMGIVWDAMSVTASELKERILEKERAYGYGIRFPHVYLACCKNTEQRGAPQLMLSAFSRALGMPCPEFLTLVSSTEDYGEGPVFTEDPYWRRWRRR